MSRKSSFAAFSNSDFSAFPKPGRSIVNVASKPVPYTPLQAKIYSVSYNKHSSNQIEIKMIFFLPL